MNTLTDIANLQQLHKNMLGMALVKQQSKAPTPRAPHKRCRPESLPALCNTITAEKYARNGFSGAAE